MLPNVPDNANYFTMVEPSTSSTCNATKHRRRSLWRLAKRLIRPMSDHHTRSFDEKLSLHYGNVDPKRLSEQLVPPILLNVFEQINIYHRIRLRQVSHLTDFLCTTIPVRLPPMKLQSALDGELYLLSEAPELVAYHLIPEIDLSEAVGDDGTVALKDWQAELILRRTASRVDHVEHLWLETSINGLLCAAFLKQLQEANTNAKPYRRKITLKKLTIVGNKKSDIEQVSKMICAFSSFIEQLRLRHMRVDSSAQSRDLWAAISLCSHLKQFQYETCRYDRHSHYFMADALADKKISTLELGGVEEFSSIDLSRLTMNQPLKHLSIVCPKISSESYFEDNIINVVRQLDTLLIQCEITYALDDLEQRHKVGKLLQNMKAEASLEIVHVVDNHAAQAARIMSYWLELSREADRTVMLKLSDISQDRIDQAIGRLIRKCSNVLKAAHPGNSLVLTRGNGRIHVLDKYTWFGDDEDDY
uniref:F-box domain-containing protein n=1 Tax=Parascaris univalens TaxID=6257 RepID=A0A915BS63_PARUN